MCPAAGYAFFGGARGPRPTGQVRYPPVGDGVSTSHQRGSAALLGPPGREARRDGLPRRFAPRNDKVRRGGRLCPPEQREALSFRASDRVTGVGIRFPRTDKNWFRIFHKKEIILISAQMSRITPESCGKNCQIRHFAQISRRMLADVPKFRKLREITCKRHAAVVHLHYTS